VVFVAFADVHSPVHPVLQELIDNLKGCNVSAIQFVTIYNSMNQIPTLLVDASHGDTANGFYSPAGLSKGALHQVCILPILSILQMLVVDSRSVRIFGLFDSPRTAISVSPGNLLQAWLLLLM
jgi:hypothetical protein